MEAAADRLNGAGVPVSVTMMLQKEPLNYCPADKIEKRCYIRLSLLDKPGSLGKVMLIFGKHNISVASVVQNERHKTGYAPVVVLTHKATEAEFAAAIEEISALDISGNAPVRMRIEDFE
jgi:homoserine dehydrogenase